jgi:putative membrane protein
MSTSDIPYGQFRKEELILRDHLAAQRTVLANERTLLAYTRTALTFLIGGVTFLQFFGHVAAQVLGWIFLPAALVTAAVGGHHYRRMKRLLVTMQTEPQAGDGGAH